ncbi:MAG: sigma-54 dependent transcriptional regulator [Deltaproteobacteria bacterium]|nr:sigma-54 dependent transcriptional regulator [Deltaproteobacteria bacterium]
MGAIPTFVFDEKNQFSPMLFEELTKRGFALRVVGKDELFPALSSTPPDLVIFNLAATPGVDHLTMIQEIRSIDEHLPVFVLTESSDVATAVSFMRAGASDFMVLPASTEQFEASLKRASQMYHLARKVFQVERKAVGKGDFLGIVGQSGRMQENFKMISTVAKSNATVLIQGDSGTGKELVAKAIHVMSGRPKHKFIDLNCGAIPRELLENELFGHERGAYTGADRRYIGSFERANGGTIFLDEISEMDPSLQVKILRVLQERSFQRVGGSEKVHVDVRVVAATNRDLQKEVEEGRFREDLFYRLNVVPVWLPPLRDRREDIPLLARHFLNIYSLRNDKIFLDFHPEAVEVLINYGWPGNVRELENTIERLVVLSNDSQVKVKHLPAHLQNVERAIGWSRDQNIRSIASEKEVFTLEQIEKQAIESALKKCEGNVLEAARRLKVGQATLYRKIRKFGIAREES